MRVLLVEDSERLQRSITEGLVNEGFAVDVASNGLDGLALIDAYNYDVVILDIMLPGMDGLSVLRKVRAEGKNTHVLILSSKDQVEDRIAGLEIGADDYLIKPFVFQELVARIKALIRRKYDKKAPFIKIGSLEVNTSNHDVKQGERDVVLTPKEYCILELLLLKKGSIVSREQIVEKLYDGYGEISSNVIDVLVCTLRRKLSINQEEKLIQTRRGMGYIIES